MERFVKGEVVVLEFPYTDLSKTKKRPSLIVANLKGDNLILCQITGQSRPDPDLIDLKKEDFQTGELHRNSFIMPSFVFTIHKSKIDYVAGKIKQEKIKEVEKKLCEIFTR
ncbi:growth inhibitor PemK [Candidatus Pacearchaeota archaeon CG10_big_fil_rev_8_21_14_0_10_31_24]|nr:MAG: growth inhibitor PemK [Candidatus Pacearchaeota archaeon CG10_big_fil_rev_8_21_14_0_10_31_24]